MTTPAARHVGADDPGQAIAAARKTQGLAQSELARQAAISLSLLRKIERGIRSLTPGVRSALDAVLVQVPGPADSGAGTKRITAALVSLREVMDTYDIHAANRGTEPHDQLDDGVAALFPVRKARRHSRVNHRPDGHRPEQHEA
jgi:transcriptional regulator with XRE-family HTH domain